MAALYNLHPIDVTSADDWRSSCSNSRRPIRSFQLICYKLHDGPKSDTPVLISR